MISFDELKRMRRCADLLPPPGSIVVKQLVDEAFRLRAALTKITLWDDIGKARFTANVALEPNDYVALLGVRNATNDQIAKIMLLHGTPQQQEEALVYCKKSCDR